MAEQTTSPDSALAHPGHVLVTGASSGVGLALAKQLLPRDSVRGG